MLRPIKRGILRRRHTAHLHDAVLQGDLRPGQSIVEGKIVRELGVAQGKHRQAFQELDHKGLVTKYDHRSTYVSRLTSTEIKAP